MHYPYLICGNIVTELIDVNVHTSGAFQYNKKILHTCISGHKLLHKSKTVKVNKKYKKY